MSDLSLNKLKDVMARLEEFTPAIILKIYVGDFNRFLAFVQENDLKGIIETPIEVLGVVLKPHQAVVESSYEVRCIDVERGKGVKLQKPSKAATFADVIALAALGFQKLETLK